MENQQDPYNRGGFYAFVFSVAFCLLFFVYISFVHKGVDLGEIPEVAQPAEQAVAGEQPATKAFDMGSVTKPWEESADVANYGAGIFKTNCAICHGPEGKGDGMAGKSLVPRPRNLVEGKWTAGGDSIALYKTIKSGLPNGSPMAGFGHLPKSDRWALVQYIHSITQNKISDDSAALAKYAETSE